mmetsp:Transcript_408/g.3087  ORF Transcript_408/g.3087 Transcript_408/m.3087 type:complete len:114 (-) Transcript_408:821-1162(-)
MSQPSFCDMAYRWKTDAFFTKSILCPCFPTYYIGRDSRVRCTQLSHIRCRMTGENVELHLVLSKTHGSYRSTHKQGRTTPAGAAKPPIMCKANCSGHFAIYMIPPSPTVASWS